MEPKQKKILAITLPTLLVIGAFSVHRWNRNRELDRQLSQKRDAIVTVSAVTVENRRFQGSIPFTGTLLAVNRAELKAEVAGRVTRVAVREGDRVGAGMVLSTQDEEDLLLGVQAAEAQLAQAQAQAQQARRDNDRAQSLLEKRSITKQAAQQAETHLSATTAAVRAAESNLGIARSRLHKSQIRSPFPGQVAQRLTQPGEMLSPGQPAFVVVDNSKLEILADLPTEAAASVKVGMKAVFRVQGLSTETQVTGEVTQVSPSLMADGRTLRVRIEVPNPGDRLKSGFFAEGEILADLSMDRPALPATLLNAQGREADVYVIEASAGTSYARRKRVTLGTEQQGWRPVEGLAAGTKVVGQGRDQVQDGSALKVVDGAVAGQGR